LAAAVLAVIGLAGWRVHVIKSDKNSNNQAPLTSVDSSQSTAVATTTPSELIWQQAEGGWRSTQSPPACPAQPMMSSPTDLKKATAILYPGQTRGGNYKPHGGFRFDNSTNSDVMVTAPIDGFIVRGGRYLSEGEVQYTFDIMNNCGVMYRVGHFRTLPSNLQQIADSWPQPQEGDSRTQSVNPAIYVKQGAVLATSVGIINAQNTFFDWGVYDYRQTNEASKSAAYQKTHAQDKELSWHAVCWFDWLRKEDASMVKTLPAGDPTSGKTSDYCK
jgi:hypothetical protein